MFEWACFCNGIQTVWYTDGIPERCFWKSLFKKKCKEDKKHVKFPSMQKDLQDQIHTAELHSEVQSNSEGFALDSCS